MQLSGLQEAAVHAVGNVLVVAGAGTGKTSTLVARCLRLVLVERCPLDRILMVTFTEAAAAEMRQRIRQALTDAGSAPGVYGDSSTTAPGAFDRAWAEEQIALLDQAHISTLHGFCLELLRQHFHDFHRFGEPDIDPLITVLDEQQTRPIIEAALESVFESHYAGQSAQCQAVRQMIRRYGRGSDESIRALVRRIHRYTQTLPDPDDWLELQVRLFEKEEPDTWLEWLKADFAEWRELWTPVLRQQPPDNSNAHDCVEILEGAGEISHLNLDGITRALHEIANVDESWPRDLKGRYRDPIEKFFDESNFLRSVSAPGAIKDDWEWSRHHMTALLGLVREFTREFSRVKRESGGVDFADLEQLSLRLLRHPSTGEPTEIAVAWRERFDYVFVDECQDINAAQDGIISALSRTGAAANRFLVGDVKQSIYRFRLADPAIFRRYEEEWGKPGTPGTRIPLADNFRSREGVLDFVNSLFDLLMRPALGGIRYDADARLRFGNREGRAALSNAQDASPRVEFHLINRPGASQSQGAEIGVDKTGDLSSTEREARFVAVRLRQLKDQGHPVWDPELKGLRPVEWRDMVVLLRSPAGRVEAMAKEFHRAGVPLMAEREGFHDAAEVMDLMNLLRLLDNPLQDIPLLAVLRSPLAGLSLDELVEIRVHASVKPFWTAMRAFHREKKPRGNGVLPAGAWQKVDLFIRQFDAWRDLIRHVSLSLCIERAMFDTHYEAMLMAEERGMERLANVRRLLDLARSFDAYRGQGLYRFLRFVDVQEEAGAEERPAPPPTGDAVRLLSIHRSKGLEFPVVVLAGMGSQFNFRDLNSDVFLNDYYGLCPRVAPPDVERKYPSLPFWLAARRERRELVGEELRLLYVALTRARDSLLLVGSPPRGSETAWSTPTLDSIPDLELLGQRSYLGWLRLWLAASTSAGDWRNAASGQTKLIRWQIHDELAESIRTPVAEDPGSIASTQCDAGGLVALRQRLEWRYSHAAATLEPAKTSVSVLRRRALADDEDESGRLFGFQPRVVGNRNRASGAGALSAVETGQASHRYLELISLDRTGSMMDLRNEAERMRRAGLLTDSQIEALDFKGLLEFWLSPVGRKIISRTDNVQREIPFTARLSAADMRGLDLENEARELTADDFIVVQGVVDLAVVTDEEVWILDFKTDRIKARDLAKKSGMYRPQLKLYALALERIYGRPVRHRWLHFLELGRTVDI